MKGNVAYRELLLTGSWFYFSRRNYNVSEGLIMFPFFGSRWWTESCRDVLLYRRLPVGGDLNRRVHSFSCTGSSGLPRKEECKWMRLENVLTHQWVTFLFQRKLGRGKWFNWGNGPSTPVWRVQKTKLLRYLVEMWGWCWLKLRDAVINAFSSRAAGMFHRPSLEKASAFLEKHPFIVVVTEWQRSLNLRSIPHLLWAKTRIVTMVKKKTAASLQRFHTPRKFCSEKEPEYKYMKQTDYYCSETEPWPQTEDCGIVF